MLEKFKVAFVEAKKESLCGFTLEQHTNSNVSHAYTAKEKILRIVLQWKYPFFFLCKLRSFIQLLFRFGKDFGLMLYSEVYSTVLCKTTFESRIQYGPV